MSSENEVTLIGRLGKDPEQRATKEGTVVANLSVATSDKYKSGDEWKENTEWHRVVAFGQPAEYATKYLHKGDLVYIKGKLKTRKWEKDGVAQYTTEVHAWKIKGLGSGKKQEERSTSGGSFDEIPF